MGVLVEMQLTGAGSPCRNRNGQGKLATGKLRKWSRGPETVLPEPSQLLLHSLKMRSTPPFVLAVGWMGFVLADRGCALV
jgi:hypothetical protein